MGWGLQRVPTERPAGPGGHLMKKGEKSIQKYGLIRKIGEGGQGKTEIVERHGDGKIFVRKEQEKFTKIRTSKGYLPMEMYIFENIIGTKAPYSIIQFDHCNYTEAGLQTLYFEYCDGGDLDQLVGTNVSEGLVWRCFTQIAEALAFLHYGINPHSRYPTSSPRDWRPIVHRDVKPGNIFIRRRQKHTDGWEFVLGDFGLATVEEVTSGCGTGEWIGPEVPEMTAKGDVWSLGAVLHALCHGEGPVSDPPKHWTSLQAHQHDWSPHTRKPRKLAPRYSNALNNNMFYCLTRNPKNRYSSRALTESLAKDRHRGYF